MLVELSSMKKAVGVKQTRKAIRDHRARRVFLACDADPAITDPIAAQCREMKIPVVRDCSMSRLGKACGISVGASAAAVLGSVREDSR